MKTKLMALLQALEEVFPPPAKGHHAITFNTYGGEPRLGLHLHVGAENLTFFLEDEDFEKTPNDIIAEIRSQL